MKSLFLFLTTASLAVAVAPPVSTPAPVPTAFTNLLINTVIPQEKAEAAAVGTSSTEKSYLQGKIDSTNYLANLVGQNPGWMTNFATKMNLEQTKMEVIEQQIVVYDLFGADPTTALSQYWQGYEDAIQDTVDSMNTWPNTGGPVPGTTTEYTIHITNASDTDTTTTVAVAAPKPAPSAATTIIRLAPAPLRRSVEQRTFN
jgi:hypothetical protein